MEKYIAPESGWIGGRRVEAGAPIELHPKAAKYAALAPVDPAAPAPVSAEPEADAETKKGRK